PSDGSGQTSLRYSATHSRQSRSIIQQKKIVYTSDPITHQCQGIEANGSWFTRSIIAPVTRGPRRRGLRQRLQRRSRDRGVCLPLTTAAPNRRGCRLPRPTVARSCLAGGSVLQLRRSVLLGCSTHLATLVPGGASHL